MALSFELSPADLLSDLVTTFDRYQPAFYSMTEGVKGQSTYEAVAALSKCTKTPIVPHIACGDCTRDQLQKIITDYRALGCQRALILRGNASGRGDFRYASDAVAWVRECAGEAFYIDVAAYPEKHPESPSLLADVQNLKRKIDAGASGVLTQYFYHAESFSEFSTLCYEQGIDVPIIPGVMPITSLEKSLAMAKQCGVVLSEDLQQQVAEGPEAGTELVVQLCQQLIAMGAQGLHFYTLNQAKSVEKILHMVSDTIEKRGHCEETAGRRGNLLQVDSGLA